MRSLATIGLAVVAISALLLLDVVTDSCPSARCLPAAVLLGSVMTLPAIMGRRS